MAGKASDWSYIQSVTKRGDLQLYLVVRIYFRSGKLNPGDPTPQVRDLRKEQRKAFCVTAKDCAQKSTPSLHSGQREAGALDGSTLSLQGHRAATEGGQSPGTLSICRELGCVPDAQDENP